MANRDLCIMACVFCRDKAFHKWAQDGVPYTVPMGEEMAKAFILNTCRVGSRNDLDKNPVAAQLFHEKIRKPFLEWKEAQGAKS